MNTSGQLNAMLDYIRLASGDRIPDAHMAEIVRRLKATVDPGVASDIVSTLAEPADLTKIWWPINPTTGSRVGNPKVWDNLQSKWVDFGTLGLPTFIFRQRRNGRQQIASGAGSAIIPFDTIGTTAYQVKLTTVFFVDGVWTAVPATMNDYFVGIGNQSENQFTLVWKNSPTGGVSIDWELATTDGTADVIGEE